jgi:hypothetical protein
VGDILHRYLRRFALEELAKLGDSVPLLEVIDQNVPSLRHAGVTDLDRLASGGHALRDGHRFRLNVLRRVSPDVEAAIDEVDGLERAQRAVGLQRAGELGVELRIREPDPDAARWGQARFDAEELEDRERRHAVNRPPEFVVAPRADPRPPRDCGTMCSRLPAPGKSCRQKRHL